MNSTPRTQAWAGDSAAAKAFLWYLRALGDHPAKLRLARWMAVYGFRRALPIRCPGSARLVIDTEDWIGRQIAFHGAYEPATLQLARRLLAPGGTFVDVGACFGLFTCAVGVLPGVRCISVEPSPDSFLALCRNIARNPQVQATLYHVAVDAVPNVVRFIAPDPTNRGKNRVALGAADGDGFMVAAVSLAELLEREIGDAAPTLIKIDVEGLEARVLRGLDFGSRRRPQNIILELNACLARTGEHSDSLVSFLRSRGYEALCVDGSPLDLEREPSESNVWFKAT